MDSAKLSSRSLIMCVTPLQMIIAEKIIKLNPEQNFDLLVIALCDNDKYYFDKLKKLCSYFLSYHSKVKGIVAEDTVDDLSFWFGSTLNFLTTRSRR